MRSIFSKLILLFLLTALIPIGISYFVSTLQVRKATEKSVIQGNLEVAKVAATDVENYFENARRVLKALAAQFGELNLTEHQKDRLLKNSYLDFKYFQNIHLFDLDGKLIATSLLEPKPEKIPFDKILPQIKAQKPYLSPIYIATEPPPVRPAIRVALPVIKLGEVQAVLISEINLIYVWHLVNEIRIGEQGIVTLIDQQGQVVASSDLGLVFELKPFPQYESLKANISGTNESSLFYSTDEGNRHLLVSAPLEGDLRGNIFIEQPTSEAFFLAKQMTRQLFLFVVLIVFLMILVGYLGVRWQILRNLRTLTEGIKKIGEGDWKHKVQVRSKDEFKQLGDAINTMTDHLDEQAEKIKRQERVSLIGRIAGVLVHDLKHPIQNIRNWTKLLKTNYADKEFRENFSNIVNWEFENVDLFFKNLKDLTGEIPFNPVLMSVEQLFNDVLERFRMEAEKNNITLQKKVNPPDIEVSVDRFSMSRVLSNLISNSLDAMKKGGRIDITAELKSEDGRKDINISVVDTGMGIPPERLKTLFQDFATTKRKGLGLGLALTQKIVEQHGGTISVHSEVGNGTRFDLKFPEGKV